MYNILLYWPAGHFFGLPKVVSIPTLQKIKITDLAQYSTLFSSIFIANIL